MLVVTEISNRTNGLREDQKSICVAQVVTLQQLLHDLDTDHDARQIIIHHSRMTQVGTKDERLIAFATSNALTHLQRSKAEVRIDDDSIRVVCKTVFQILTTAESPIALVILENERNRFIEPR